jgi:hypothetical protein
MKTTWALMATLFCPDAANASTSRHPHRHDDHDAGVDGLDRDASLPDAGSVTTRQRSAPTAPGGDHDVVAAVPGHDAAPARRQRFHKAAKAPWWRGTMWPTREALTVAAVHGHDDVHARRRQRLHAAASGDGRRPRNDR